MKIFTVAKSGQDRVVFSGATFEMKQSGRSGFFLEIGADSTIRISNELLLSKDALITDEVRSSFQVYFLTLLQASVAQDDRRILSLVPAAPPAEGAAESVLVWIPGYRAEVSDLKGHRLSEQLVCLSAGGEFLVTVSKNVNAGTANARKVIEEQFEVRYDGTHFLRRWLSPVGEDSLGITLRRRGD